MTAITHNSYLQQNETNEDNFKLTRVINSWAGVNYLANSLFKLNESNKHTNSLFVHTSRLISKDTDTKNEKILKLLSATLGITHIALIITLMSDLILSHYKSSETQSDEKDDTLVNLWLKEMNTCMDPAILSDNFVQILLKDYLKENEVINREDLLRFNSIVKNYIQKDS